VVIHIKYSFKVPISAFNKNYEQFKQATANLAKDLNRRGILVRYNTGIKETWHLGINQENALTTYESFRGGFETSPRQENQSFLEVYLRPLSYNL